MTGVSSSSMYLFRVQNKLRAHGVLLRPSDVGFVVLSRVLVAPGKMLLFFAKPGCRLRLWCLGFLVASGPWSFLFSRVGPRLVEFLPRVWAAPLMLSFLGLSCCMKSRGERSRERVPCIDGGCWGNVASAIPKLAPIGLGWPLLSVLLCRTVVGTLSPKPYACRSRKPHGVELGPTCSATANREPRCKSVNFSEPLQDKFRVSVFRLHARARTAAAGQIMESLMEQKPGAGFRVCRDSGLGLRFKAGMYKSVQMGWPQAP